MLHTIFSLALLTGAASADDAEPRERHVFNVDVGAEEPLPVHMYVPRLAGDDAPVILVMHGTRRNADDYRDNWMDIARGCRVVIAAPEFSRTRFPGSAGYNLGGLGSEGEGPIAFDMVEPIFEAVRDRYAPQTEGYGMFGHSAGSQFVHRYVMFRPAENLDRAIAANAGWYTVPDRTIEWPYGLKDAPETPHSDETIAQLPIELHLGDRDTETDGANLRQTPEASAQGPHRFARGAHMARFTGWRVISVSGVGHSNSGMVPAAATSLMDEDIRRRSSCRRALRGN
ncbi:MAG: hypothetical protein AAFX09_04275 [Pseudomonadota bacterium]